MTFKEKILWIALAALALTFGAYFWLAWATWLPLPAGANVGPHHAGLFIGATVVLVLIIVAGSIAVALTDRHTEEDERDRWIELRGTRNGSYVLATGVFAALCAALLTDGNAVMAHVLLAAWVLAQGVEIGSQLVMYRRG